MIDTGLAGRVVVVTGANHGIGAATAAAFARAGASVFVHYLRGEPIAGDASEPGEAAFRAAQAQPPDEVLQAIVEAGGHAEAWEADLAETANVPELFDRAEAALGPVEVLVNNAARCDPETFLPRGVTTFDPFDQPLVAITAESHDRHFPVNSRAAALLIAEYARRHIEREAAWGRIVSVSTDAAAGFAGQVSYGASKAALESYTLAAARELARFGITANIVSPGPTQTGYISSAIEEQLKQDIPLGRLGRPEDIADVIVFLASEQARWVTGQRIYSGGGHELA